MTPREAPEAGWRPRLRRLVRAWREGGWLGRMERRHYVTGLALLVAAAVMTAAYFAFTQYYAAPTPDPFDTPREGPQVPIEIAEKMDELHQARMDAFPAETEGRGNQTLESRVEDGVRVFELTAEVVSWEVEPGMRREAWVYNGTSPGPEIRVQEGERIRVILHNQLPESTSIHWHGQQIQHAMDGVPFLTQPPVKPGKSFTYEFVARTAGSHMYHSHHNSAKQVARGLLGALIVEPSDPDYYPREVDREYTLIVGDGPLGFTLNGKSFPATEPLEAELGETVLIRWMNEGALAHPMHIHGLVYEVVARDGHPLPQPWRADTVLVAPGERWDVLVKANNPGAWLIHCHILPHSEGEHGMYGMTTLFIVRD